jgi:tagatose-1,6-bisphosphate aldolase non-catalytic subunit AgaZ/GatZ
MRLILPSDIHSAQRGLGMLSMSPADLRKLIAEMADKDTFAARVIVLGARQMLAVKLRTGAE